MAQVAWITDMDTALSRAKAEGKPILLDFFNPNWIGCQQMDAVTYPDDNVALFLNTRVVPIRLQFNAKPYAKDFNVTWTPTLVTLDENGKEHYRTVGFLSAAELIPSLLMGIAKVYFDLGRLEEALAVMERIIADYPKSKAAPEAVFHRGVARYKSTHDPKQLRAAYDKLTADYPSSDWADRAQPYRLIQ